MLMQERPPPIPIRRADSRLGPHGVPVWYCSNPACGKGRKVLMELQLTVGVAYKRCPSCGNWNELHGEKADE